ncbi:hypothetical protein Cgig2_032560 [Carnegiea gigantea]|uniref:Uncharacterized protein n=1 Tax=Carnegiea gigantea TaxID=171969 RepID=A0A9Q1KW20_9CARY|nr:hypothetical protein Cgig2_032560 [Carnegiea gigantea]
MQNPTSSTQTYPHPAPSPPPPNCGYPPYYSWAFPTSYNPFPGTTIVNAGANSSKGSGSRFNGGVAKGRYPEELKKYGYPPPFPPGYPPEKYEKYGYPPADSSHDGSSSITRQTHPDSASPASIIDPNLASVRDYGVVPLPWGPGSYIPIAGNVYNSGFNYNDSGTQTTGDVIVGNHTEKK